MKRGSFVFNKKGLSTIVSTLLILLLVFVAIGLLWIVIRNVIEGGTEEISLGKLTLDLSIENVVVSGNNLGVKVKRNPGAGTFTGLSFIISDGRNAEVIEIQNASLDEYVSRTFTIAPQEIAVANIRSIEIAPIFTLESGKEVTGDVKSSYSFSGSSVGDSQVVSCSSDNDCVTGYVCNNSQCILENCAADNACAANTCTGQTCQDSCTNVYAGTLQPDCGTRECGLAPNQCGSCGSCATGETCSALGQCIVQSTSSATITGLAASSYDSAGPYPPEYVLDDDLGEESRWSADGSGQSITFTLSSSATVNQVQIAFYRGDQRTYTFDVQTSTDGSTWNNVLTSQTSSGTSTSLETFTFTSTSASYVRIVGYGNTVNTWNSYTEIKVQDFASSVDLCPIMTCADTDSCTTDSCSNSQCTFTPISGCVPDPCENIVCSDGDLCTADSCSAGSCVYTPISGCSASGGDFSDIPVYTDYSTIVYIDPELGSAGNGGTSPSDALSSWNDVSSLQADTAYVQKMGTTDSGKALGANANNIFIGSYPDASNPGAGRPLINYQGTVTPGLFDINGDGFVIRDLELVAPNTNTPLRFWYTADNNTVFNNSIHDSIWTIRSFGNYMRVLNNELYNSQDDGVFFQDVTGAEIAYNYIHDVNLKWFPGASETVAPGDGIQLEPVDYWHVHHNVIDRTGSGNKFGFIANNANPPADDYAILEYNTFIGPTASGTSIYLAQPAVIVRNNQITDSPQGVYSWSSELLLQNNTFVGQSTGVNCLNHCILEGNTFDGVTTAFTGNYDESGSIYL